MDQIVETHELTYSPAKARALELGYDREAIAFLGISRLKGVGFQTLFSLGGRPGISDLLNGRNASEIAKRVSHPMGVGKSGGWDEFSRKIWSLGQELAQPLIDRRVRFLFCEDAHFPSPLASLPDELRPRWLFVAGDIALLERPSVAVVGTRDPTEDGDFLARYAVSCAKEAEAPVVSGLAHGIDRLVHEWCLHLSVPTISVLGTGILTPYPAKHAPLGDAIVAAGGTVLTEYLPTQGPSGQQFVWRNRLQAALSRVTIPVEWKQKSGTAHTVRFSRKLGHPVIGLRLHGVSPDPEAGTADQQFIVPNEHSNLIDALKLALISGAPTSDGRQADLFG
jgi:DNA protecting protein DprA